MTPTFRLEIKLGNDAMKDRVDVAVALHRVARRLESGSDDEGMIPDENDNHVGSWTLDEEDK